MINAYIFLWIVSLYCKYFLLHQQLIGLKLSDFYILPKHIALQKLYDNYNKIHFVTYVSQGSKFALERCRIVKQLQFKMEEKEYNHEDTSIVRDLNFRAIAREVLISF